ncbi:MAG TPA: amidohydrolase family protein, partial [Acidimicrobiia bacterium]
IRLVDEMSPDERPEVEAAARIITTEGGYFPGFGVVANSTTLASAVEAEAAAGRGWVKLIGDWPRRGVGPVTNFDQTDLENVVGIAEAVGARVAIHAMARDTPTRAVAAGVHSIEHGLFLSEEDLGHLGARSGMWVPTLLRTEATAADLAPGSSGRRRLTEGLAGLRRLLPIAIEAGVMVLTGTDLIGAPRDVAAEALRLAEFGLNTSQVVAAVSTNGYLATGRDPGFTPGTTADAVLFSASPWQDLAVLAHPHLVVRRGRVL